MLIVFGWEKVEGPVGDVGKIYCYGCRKHSEWFVWRVAEWVTLSDLRVISFKKEHELICESCRATFPLSKREFRRVNRIMRRRDSITGSRIHKQLSRRIESEQLAGKSKLQLDFIRKSQAAEEDYRSLMQQQDRGDT